MRNTFKKHERLCSKLLLEQLFKDGKSFAVFPFRVVYKIAELPSDSPAQVAFSVPKKKFKRAVDRNRIKRLMKEAYRLNKQIHYDHFRMSGKQCALLIMYLGKGDIEFAEAQQKIIRLLQRLTKENVE